MTTGRCDLVVGSTDSRDDIRAADAVSRGEPRQEIHAGKLGNREKGLRFNPTSGPWARKHLQIVRAGPRATGMRRPGLVRDDSRMSDSVRRFRERRLERSSNWKVAWLGGGGRRRGSSRSRETRCAIGSSSQSGKLLLPARLTASSTAVAVRSGETGETDHGSLRVLAQSCGLKLYVPVQLKLGPPGPPNGRETAAVA